jgi:hypothetical protein
MLRVVEKDGAFLSGNCVTEDRYSSFSILPEKSPAVVALKFSVAATPIAATL